MTDPLSDVIRLLQPRAVQAKAISGAGRWGVRYAAFGAPGFCAVTEGRCRLAVEGHAPLVLEAGDFVLLPATPAFVMSGFEPVHPLEADPRAVPPDGREVRHGRAEGPADVRMVGGYFAFGSADAGLLVALLPGVIHIRDAGRLAVLVGLLGEEAARDMAGRAPILERLVEILLIEALRVAPGPDAAPGLLKGLADRRIAGALRALHDDPARAWTVVALAREAGLSRSAFFDRFGRTVGMRPMAYLLAWRMALAGAMLRGGGVALDAVARQVGYGSASSFSTAFSRHAGVPPGHVRRAA